MMKNNNFNFQRMLCPIETDVFFEKYWEKRPLIVSDRAPDYYYDLLSMSDVDSLVFYGSQGESDVKLVKGRQPPYRNYMTPDMPKINQAYTAYCEGYSVVVNNLATRHKPVSLFIKELEDFLNHPAQINLYLTPAKSQAFESHFDTHDVFILQVDGKKHWCIYDAFLEKLPLKGKARPVWENQLPPEPLHEIVLNPGDLLYLPRGFIHHAYTTDESSLHLTLGIHNFRWADLIAHSLSLLSRQEVQLRESVPPGFLNGDEIPAEVQARFKELLTLLLNKANLKHSVELLCKDLVSNRPPVPDGHFAQLDKFNHINLGTKLTKREGLLHRVTEDGHYASIQFSGNVVRGPRKVSSALQFVAKSDQFSVHDMPNLAEQEKLVLARTLVKEGLLRVLDN